MTIVPLERRHRDDVVRMLERSREFRPEEVVVAIEVLDAALSGGYRALVAENDERAAIGWACFDRTPLTDWTFDLYWLVVDPDARRARAGRRLVERTLELVREDGGRVVRVETSSKHGGAVTRAFYGSVGFVESGRIPEFYGPADDLVLWHLRLGEN